MNEKDFFVTGFISQYCAFKAARSDPYEIEEAVAAAEEAWAKYLEYWKNK